MPLLTQEPCLFPDDVFAQDSVDIATSDRWWVVHAKARCEKSLVRSLHHRRVSFFLPLYEHSWRNRGRRHTAFLPLFPGYVFVRGDECARLAALETNQVVQFLTVPNQEKLHQDLSRVFRVLSGDVPLTPENGFQPGMPVEIVSGPFQGLRGKLLRQGSKARLLVEVEFLQQGVSIEIETWMVRRVDDGTTIEPGRTKGGRPPMRTAPAHCFV